MQFAILQLFLSLRLTEIVHDAGDHLGVKLISEQLKSSICENNKMIQIQPELDWPI